MNKVIRKKFLLPILLLTGGLLYIEPVIQGAKKALTLCAVSIVPSLFVFTVLSDFAVTMLLEDDNLRIPPKAIAFLIGSFCGFPLGAIVCNKLYETGKIKENDAVKIVPFCNNASFAFVVGVIGVSVFNNKMYGYILFASQLLASVPPLLFIKTQSEKSKTGSCDTSISKAFFSSIEKSVKSILKICGIICIFASIIEVLNCFSLSFASVLLELSNAVIYCKKLYEMFPAAAFSLCGFCCGFSGLCVHMQIKSAFKSNLLKLQNLFICKLLQGLLCMLFSYIGYKLIIYT